MQAGSFVRAASVGLFFVLGSCGAGSGVGEKSFQKQYAVARDALERGHYVRATETYAVLIPQSGPLKPRLTLEYTHALLRAGRFEKASAHAEALARSSHGTARSAALAVQGTADHELGLTALFEGDKAAGKQHLQKASAALGELLAKDADLDPLGSMAERKSSIDATLKTL
ncbi:hypothetical protein [Roseovarius aestuariivivens]|uniref:hypothetical protein n=1 Tax=Roseovarius aestuariivivens TaxID=1888910 RepID=UPI0010812AF1|nr:hypothetical protein [Roseovarius aestuariivivens]